MVSIIVPVYNEQKYISRCIDSILKQTYRDFELIIVDDGSTDKTGEICDMWGQRDTRIQVIHKVNAGVSVARNVALKRASGKYVMFVDADDRLVQNSIELMLEKIGERDWVIGSYNKVRWGLRKSVVYNENVYSYESIRQEMKTFDSLISTPWGKLYKLQIVRDHKIEFDEGRPYGEDHAFNLKYCKYIKECRIIKDVVYDYTLGGIASSIKYYEDIGRYNRQLLDDYVEFFGNNESVPEEFLKLKIRGQLFGSVEHYIVCCKHDKAVEKINEVFEIYKQYIVPELINAAYYSDNEKQSVFDRDANMLLKIILDNKRMKIYAKRAKRLINGEKRK